MADSKQSKPVMVDPERASQRQAAWVTGKPPVWLRDHADVGGCNLDGTYNLRELVKSLVKAGDVADLADAEREQLWQVCEAAAHNGELHRPAAVALLRRIADRDGAAGLAAIGELLLGQFEQVDREFPSPYAVEKTADELREECARRIANLADPNRNAAEELRVLQDCRECGAFRFAGEWRKGKLPRGFLRTTEYHGDDPLHLCPSCEAKR